MCLYSTPKGCSQVAIERSNERLRKCWGVLWDWLTALPFRWSDFLDQSDVMDEVVVEFVNYSHRVGTPFYVVKHAVLYLQWSYRGLAGELSRTWDALHGWHLSQPWRPRVPFPEDVVLYIFLSCLEWALGLDDPSEKDELFRVGLCLWIAFDGLLRPGDMFGLYLSDVRITRRQNGPPTGVVAIRNPKTRAHMGRMQFAVLRDVRLCCWIEWFLARGAPRRAKLWPHTQTRFRTLLKGILNQLGLSKMHYNVSSCRAGGATHRFVCGESVERLQFQGRWSSLSSLKSYIQESMAWLVWSVVPQHLDITIASQLKRLAPVLHAPPASSAACLLNGDGA